MKKRSIIFLVFFSLVFIFAGCKSTVDNSFTIQNLSAANVIVTFRAQTISVAAGGTSVIKEIPKGTYSYSTLYEFPAGSTSSSQGDMTGSMVIKAGTKILLLFSSTYDSGTGSYVLSASLSSSDDESSGTLTSP